MKRPAHDSKTLERIRKWREICPELTIRSTFIVGFPGETEEDFQYLLDWLDEAQLDRVGAFTYSPVRSEEHTSELQSRPHLVCRLLLEKKKPHNVLIAVPLSRGSTAS